MTHKDLIKIGKSYLKKVQKCHVIISERGASISTEIPDIIGFKGARTSILIECKASRQDFRKDKDKWFRSLDAGMGQIRYYLAPKGIIPIEELPDEWGLLEVDKKLVETKKPGALYIEPNRCAAELGLLLAYINKLQHRLKIKTV